MKSVNPWLGVVFASLLAACGSDDGEETPAAVDDASASDVAADGAVTDGALTDGAMTDGASPCPSYHVL